ncbi:thioredoxin family protein [Bowmanella dokdonensis]|uniref:Thioredoxin family protein n=1 Tax=Bowmanella dokdonensis TaxID=751969 RepID=A0A939DM85_9ALTE|nr:thioredoxin family protein [Bowmanella dokdonensis]MBN7825349.1 thioredoxin family protein [Bowmanella dokdonensis]
MKRKLGLLLAISALLLSACMATGQKSAPGDAIGSVDPDKLLQDYGVFAEAYRQYQPDGDDLDAMARLEGKGLIVMFGTWCHDSEREVPRLLKLLDESQVKIAWLQLVAVDRHKQEPSGLNRQYQLHYTPTIILLSEGEEVGRIVEKPQKSLAADLAALADRAP